LPAIDEFRLNWMADIVSANGGWRKSRNNANANGRTYFVESK